MVNDNWKSQGPSYQLPARDVGFRLLGRRFSANTRSVSIKIFHPGANFGRLSAGHLLKPQLRLASTLAGPDFAAMRGL